MVCASDGDGMGRGGRGEVLGERQASNGRQSISTSSALIIG